MGRLWRVRLLCVVLIIGVAFAQNDDSQSPLDNLEKVMTRDSGEMPEEWTPPDGESSDEWFKRYGLSENDYSTLKSLMKQCNYLRRKSKGKNTKVESDEEDYLRLYGAVPTLEQARHCIKQHSTPRQKRTAAIRFENFPTYKWEIPIYYVYDSDHNNVSRNIIEEAVFHWHKNTGVRFKRMPAGVEIPGGAHIVIGAKNSGCFSYTGRLPSNNGTYEPQPVNLQHPGCTAWLGIVAHELGHVAGLWHETVRSDRDKYIKINEANIKLGRESNFDAIDEKYYFTYGKPYDLASLMHYGPRELGKPSAGPVIETWDSDYQRTIGQRTGLSHFDKKVIHDMYGKGILCPKELKCKNGGFTNTDTCFNCRCPDGYSGQYCTDVHPVEGGCWPDSHAHIQLNSSQEFCIESRDYINGGQVQRGDKCNWLIEAPTGCQIEGRFDGDFGLYCPSHSKSCFQWVEVRYQNMKRTGPRFCCTDVHRSSLVSQRNKMMVLLNAEFPLNEDRDLISSITSEYKRGFRFCYKIKNPTCLPDPDWISDRPEIREPDMNVYTTSVPISYVLRDCDEWAPWSNWSDCTRSCGGCGKSVRYRKCIRPFQRIEMDQQDCAIVKCDPTVVERYRFDLTKLSLRFSYCCYKVKSGVLTKLANPISCSLATGMGSIFDV